MRDLIDICTLTEVSLDRNPVHKSNIPYAPDHLYRAIGAEGLEDFKETGIIRAKQNSKYNYDEAYYQKGHANAMYASGAGGDVIVEVIPDERAVKTSDAGYWKAPNGNEFSKQDQIRIWQRDAKGQYTVVYDNISGNHTIH